MFIFPLASLCGCQRFSVLCTIGHARLRMKVSIRLQCGASSVSMRNSAHAQPAERVLPVNLKILMYAYHFCPTTLSGAGLHSLPALKPLVLYCKSDRTSYWFYLFVQFPNMLI